MSASHRKRAAASPRVNVVVVFTMVALALGAISAAMVARLTLQGEPTVHRAPAAVSVAPQALSQEGRIVAVTADSVTAQSVDGFARTYVIDAQTNAITLQGSMVGGAAKAFAVNDEVAIVGIVRDGTAVATAVAEKQVSDLNGPPMDGV